MNDNGPDVPDYRTAGNDTEPWMYRLPKISHYYGDYVRQAFVSAAAVMLLTAPFYADNLAAELPFEILGAVVLVAAAAMMNPRNKSVIMINSVIAGVGLVVFELWALGQYGNSTILQFALRQAMAVAFMIAFYFSMKTLRAMTMHEIGHSDFEPEPEEKRHSEHGHKGSHEEDQEKSAEKNYLDEDVDEEVTAERDEAAQAARRKEMRHREMHQRGEYND